MGAPWLLGVVPLLRGGGARVLGRPRLCPPYIPIWRYPKAPLARTPPLHLHHHHLPTRPKPTPAPRANPTTVVFWAILFPGYFTTTFAAWYNTTAHALNSVFAFTEILLPRTPLRPWWHLGPLIFLLACYLGLAYVTHATEGFYVYSFLDVQANGSGTVAGYCFGIAIGCIVLFAVVQGLVWVRLKLTEGVLGMRGRWSSRDVHAAGGAAASREEMGVVGYSKEGLMGDEAVREK